MVVIYIALPRLNYSFDKTPTLYIIFVVVGVCEFRPGVPQCMMVLLDNLLNCQDC